MSAITAKVAELRRVFDEARAAPFSSGAAELTEDLLAIRVSRDAYAVKASEISGLATDRKIVPLPSPIPELLGVAGIRGALVPVYSLAMLLGYNADTERTRWLALCGSEDPVALAFSEFDGYVRIPVTQLYAAEQKDVARTHVQQVVRATDMVRAVVSIPLIRETIQRRCGNDGVSKER
ncbi:MAG TPA: chemotaxis protein CheW [Candidatus Methylomirabilis sp.]|nr:chemotaxis protein CheW [Candidatus Methylomirabilis sp.]